MAENPRVHHRGADGRVRAQHGHHGQAMVGGYESGEVCQVSHAGSVPRAASVSGTPPAAEASGTPLAAEPSGRSSTEEKVTTPWPSASTALSAVERTGVSRPA